MILYPSQLSLLQALQSAENYRTQDCGKVFDNFAENFLNHPKFENQVNWLVDNKLIDEKGNITPKGRTFSSVNPSYLSDKELGIRTNQFIFKSLEKGVLAKCFQFMTEDTFLEVATLINNEMEARYPEQMAQLVKEDLKDVIARIDEVAAEEDAILNLQAPAEVVVSGEIFTEPEYVAQETKVKKSRKKVEA
jgi:hypothetical protein